MFITIYSLILLVSLIHTRRSTKIPLFWFLSLFSSIFTVLAFWLSALVLIWKGSLTLTLAGFGTVLLAIELIALLGILIRDARNFSYAEQSWLRIWRLPSLADRNSEKFYFKNSRGEQLCGKIYPPRDASFPLIIQLHGGGYTYGSIEQMNAFNLALNEWGYGVAVLPYGKIPKAHLQDILDDLKSGYEFITRERQGQYNGNTILSGRSAGGHLSLALGHLVQDPHIKGYVLFSALTDLELIFKQSTEQKNTLLSWSMRLPQLFRDVPGKPADFGLNSFRFSNSAQFFMAHGDCDPVVNIEHSELLYEKAFREGHTAVFLRLPHQSHGFEVQLDSFASQFVMKKLADFLATMRTRPSSHS